MPLHSGHTESAPTPRSPQNIFRLHASPISKLGSSHQTPFPRTGKHQEQMSDPRRPPTNSPREPRPDPTRRNTRATRQRRNRRHYVLPVFDFEDDRDNRMDPLITYSFVVPTQQDAHEYESTEHQQRAQRYYSTQILTPSTPVSPCLNATDRARRARRSRIRRPGDVDPNADVFCDITPLLEENETLSVTEKRRGDVETDGGHGDDDIPDMVLSEEEMDGDYEFVDSVKGESMDNGAARRWYGGV